MGLTEKDVDHVATLARLDISDSERARYALQLSAVLEHADDLAKLDLTGVPPTAHILPLNNVWRLDEIAPGLSRDEALANAPDKAKGCFRVPKIIE
ncbi:MAG: Asp-tRNA(Asn)/Glu-tRNA(Gln) amidotransferase subunit GatC [bacterium]